MNAANGAGLGCAVMVTRIGSTGGALPARPGGSASKASGGPDARERQELSQSRATEPTLAAGGAPAGGRAPLPALGRTAQSRTLGRQAQEAIREAQGDERRKLTATESWTRRTHRLGAVRGPS